MIVILVIIIISSFILIVASLGSGSGKKKRVTAQFVNANTGRTVHAGHGRSVGEAIIDGFQKMEDSVTCNSKAETIESKLNAMRSSLSENIHRMSKSDVQVCYSYIHKMERLLSEKRSESERRKQQIEQQRKHEADENRRRSQEIERVRKAEQVRKKREAEAERLLKESQMSEQRRYIAQERRKMNDSIRYDVLIRDGRRCVLCGATARDGVKLHVDHIIPLAKGGKTEMSNLRTLCERCNMGKRDKIEVLPSEIADYADTEQNIQTVTPDEFAAMVSAQSQMEYESADDFIKMLKYRSIAYNDKRASGGCLWVRSSKENDPLLSKVRIAGAGLEYAKSTRKFNGAPGWFIK